jgi:quercetin dioxygenase-like cupin family protein
MNMPSYANGRRRRPGRFGAVAALTLVTAAVIAPIALASPGSGASSQVLGHRAALSDSLHINVGAIKFQTKDPTDFQMQTITFLPAGQSGWHHHPGIIWVIVESGAVTIYDESCHAVSTVTAGNAFLESGPEPMLVRNEGSTNAVVYNAQIVPAGENFREEDSPPSCTLPS